MKYRIKRYFASIALIAGSLYKNVVLPFEAGEKKDFKRLKDFIAS